MRLRLLPAVIAAAVVLLALKAFAFFAEGRYSPAPREAPKIVRDVDPTFRPVAAARDQAMLDIDAHPAHDGMFVPPLDPPITGSIGSGGAAADKAPPGSPPKTEPAVAALTSGGAPAAPADGLAGSATERKLLDDLRHRTAALDSRAHELDLRETLLQAAEKRLQERIGELKSLGTAAGDDGAAPGAPPGATAKSQRLAALVSIYSGMNAKDAAKIFNGLDTAVLSEIVKGMKPRQFSEILGAMDTNAAERLTLVLAGHGGDHGEVSIDALPKIEGRPTRP